MNKSDRLMEVPDVLYTKILRKTDIDWKVCQSKKKTKNIWQYVLIEEYSNDKCVNAWIRNNEGLKKISLIKHNEYKLLFRGPIYPYILVTFYIDMNARRVTIEHKYGSRSGCGCNYEIVGGKSRMKLNPLPGGWIS